MDQEQNLNENQNQEVEQEQIEETEAHTEEENQEEEAPFNLGKEIFEWIYTIAVALVIVFAIKGFLFDIVQVDGPSMDTTLAHGDRLIITKLGYTPKQGDIVILDSTYEGRSQFYNTLSAQQNKKPNFLFKLMNYHAVPENLKIRYYVKRVIATEGQTVDLVNGKVLIDGELLEEPYYNGKTTPMSSAVEFPLTVEDDEVFVMGDNRPHSKDSRDPSLGNVPEDAIIGKSQFRIWPLNKLGLTR
ncbi:MAG: signal peptidase I [Ruminococcaceae bacterium]|nr:signal peptidase I [Oscillospiraceae bacterium]